MQIPLDRIEPNPFRDFRVDPIDPTVVAQLKASIEEDGAWGGENARRHPTKPNWFQQGSGHHRTEAQRQLGLRTAEVFVGDWDDSDMIRVYARENATHRSNSGTAIAGSIASALRFIAKGVLSGDNLGKIFPTSKVAETVRGQLMSHNGIGHEIILSFLDHVPGLNEGSVRAQITNLKTSGNYARIIQEVQAEIEIEAKEAEEKAAAAEKEAKDEKEREKARKEGEKAKATRANANKAAEAAEGEKRIFDFEGVSRYFKNEHQVKTFRKLVTDSSIRDYLPVDQQAAVAKAIAQEAVDSHQELSGTFIRDSLMGKIVAVKAKQRKISEAERAALERQDLEQRWVRLQTEFVFHIRGVHERGADILKFLNENTKRSPRFILMSKMKEVIADTASLMQKLAAKM